MTNRNGSVVENVGRHRHLFPFVHTNKIVRDNCDRLWWNNNGGNAGFNF